MITEKLIELSILRDLFDEISRRTELTETFIGPDGKSYSTRALARRIDKLTCELLEPYKVD